MLVVLSSIFPIAFYLFILRVFDAFTMVRWRTMAVWMVWGIVSGLLTLGVSKGALFLGYGWHAEWVSPILEEILKCLPLVWLVYRRKVVFLAETQLYGEAIGGGFALIENILYLAAFPHMTVPTAIVRGLGTALLHMGCTALVASLLLAFIKRFDADGSKRWLFVVAPLMLVPSIGIHIFHNVSDIPPVPFMMGMLVIFFGLFYIIGRMNERIIIRWLDVSMDDDVHLITALREGRLLETKSGQYLSDLKERFDGLVFFDMCVYVQLYLELLIDAKARVMLCDAGIDITETAEQREERKGKIAELKELDKRIPRVGIRLLRPLVHSTDQDRWALMQE